MDSTPATAAGALISLVPWLLMWISCGIFSVFLAKRKGKSPLGSFFLCIIPLVNVLWLLYLASLIDIETKKTIEKLQEELRNKQNM
jgi:hypothetical protein